MRLLLIGAAGYVGSAALRMLLARRHECTVLDDLSRGHRAAVPQSRGSGIPVYAGSRDARLIEKSFLDDRALAALLERERFDAVLHFAAASLVGESMNDAGRYWRTNVAGGVALLEAMRRCGPRRIVFSSSAAVYGVPDTDPIDEDHPTRPCNPYGRTKLVFEQALEDYARTHGFAAASLRYFNAAGADPEGAWGEDHDPETHLIPRVLARALGKGEPLFVFGDDWPTRDGTCVRDYVHVLDLAQAHVAALENLEEGKHRVFNLGSSRGATVREVIETARRVTGKPIACEIGPRRAGDPPVLVASSERAGRELGWTPRYPDLETILAHAWRWHSSHPEGYRD
ncbi:MAG: UDP-glucose 4-epimerase GalE [Planctomycetota bacterium]